MHGWAIAALAVDALLLVVAVFYTWVAYAYETHEEKLAKIREKLEVALPDSPEDIEKVWGRQSLAGDDPFKVVVLAHIMAEASGKIDHEKPLHLATSYYSQVTYLVKRFCLATAIVFYMKSRQYSFQALVERFATTAERSPMDLEMIGAPDFMVAAMVPRFLVPGCWRRAMECLVGAEREFALHINPILNPVGRALVLAKLFHLTKEETFHTRVKTVGIDASNPGIDLNKLGRVARWLGMKSIGELHTFLEASDQVANQAAESPPAEEKSGAEQPPSEPQPHGEGLQQPSRLSPVPFKRRIEPSEAAKKKRSVKDNHPSVEDEPGSGQASPPEPSATPPDEAEKK